MTGPVHGKRVLEQAKRYFGDTTVDIVYTAVEYADYIDHCGCERSIAPTAHQCELIANADTKVARQHITDNNLCSIIVDEKATLAHETRNIRQRR